MKYIVIGGETEMKKVLIIMVALLVSFAFVTGVMAAEKKAKPMKATGTVTALEGKTLTVKAAKDKELAFDITNAKVPADLQVGAKVSVTYTKTGDTNVATAVTAIAERAKAKAKGKK
ncbi:MAG: hypothetical protein ABIG67_10050 [Pseudomonadota bacterium]